MKGGEGAALGALVLLAFLLRLVALDTFPASMMPDEADNLQTIYRILIRQDPGFFGLDWIQIPAFNLYVMAPAVWLGGLGLGGLRFTSALLSTLALIPLYLVARRAMSVGAALAVVALLASGLWYLHFSRSGWYNVHLCLYLLLLVWLLQRAVTEGRWRLYALAGGALGLGLYGYTAGKALPLGVLASLPLAVALHRNVWRRVVAGYGLTLLVAGVLFAPQVIAGGPEQMVSLRIATVAITNVPRPYQGETELDAILLRQVEQTIRAFLLMDPSYSTLGLNQRFVAPGWPFLDPATAVLYVAGLAIGLRRWRAAWLWWPMLLVPLFSTQVFSAGTPDGARAIMVVPVMLLFAGLAVDWLLALARRVLQGPVWSAGAALVVVAVVAYNAAGYVAWQSITVAATSRHPAVEGHEIELWRQRQWAVIQAGQWGFNVDQWKEMRDSGAKPLN